MKPIELDLMLQYRYLSALNSHNNELLFIDTLADTENNDYTQRLNALNPETKECKVLLEDKRVRYTLVDGKVLVLKGTDSKYIETDVYELDGELKKVCTLPLGVNAIHTYTDKYWFVEATSTVECPDYFKATAEEKDAYHAKVEKEKD